MLYRMLMRLKVCSQDGYFPLSPPFCCAPILRTDVLPQFWTKAYPTAIVMSKNVPVASFHVAEYSKVSLRVGTDSKLIAFVLVGRLARHSFIEDT